MTQQSFWGMDTGGHASRTGQRIVYIFRCRGRGLKVGITNNIQRRSVQLQTGNPDVLELLGSIVVTDPGDEKRIHDLLAPFHLRGEWFVDTPECLAVIDNLLHAPTRGATVGPAPRGKQITFMFHCPHCRDGLGGPANESIDILVNCPTCHKPIRLCVTVDHTLEPGTWLPDWSERS